MGYLPLSGCFQKKPPKAFIPPPPVAARVAPEQQALNLPEDAEDLSAPVEPIAITATISLPPRPPAPTAVKPGRTTPPATGEAIITPPATIIPTPNPPKPAQILSALERTQMEREFEERLKKVKDVLERVGGRNLPKDLADLRENARTLKEQAEQAREKDLPTAVSFAKRAEIFAKDLSERLP